MFMIATAVAVALYRRGARQNCSREYDFDVSIDSINGSSLRGVEYMSRIIPCFRQLWLTRVFIIH